MGGVGTKDDLGIGLGRSRVGGYGLITTRASYRMEEKAETWYIHVNIRL